MALLNAYLYLLFTDLANYHTRSCTTRRKHA